MTGWMSGGAELLLQVARTLPDTIYTKQIVAEPGLWDKVTSVASGVMTITVIILTVALVPGRMEFQKELQENQRHARQDLRRRESADATRQRDRGQCRLI